MYEVRVSEFYLTHNQKFSKEVKKEIKDKLKNLSINPENFEELPEILNDSLNQRNLETSKPYIIPLGSLQKLNSLATSSSIALVSCIKNFGGQTRPKNDELDKDEAVITYLKLADTLLHAYEPTRREKVMQKVNSEIQSIEKTNLSLRMKMKRLQTKVARVCQQATGAESVLIYMRAEDGKTSCTAWSPTSNDSPCNFSDLYIHEDSLNYWAMREQKTVRISDICDAQELGFRPYKPFLEKIEGNLKSLKAKAFMIVPIITGTTSKGVIKLINKNDTIDGAFSEGDERLVKRLAERLATASEYALWEQATFTLTEMGAKLAEGEIAKIGPRYSAFQLAKSSGINSFPFCR